MQSPLTSPTIEEQAKSTAPNGQVFPLPSEADYAAESERLRSLVAEQRLMGREIVVVMGVGFVGAVMAGVVADTVDQSGSPSKFVIGMQRPSPRSFWKIPTINQGICPVQAEDPEVAPLISRCVLDKKTLIATYSYEALALADVVVVDVQCDYHKKDFGNVRSGHAEIGALEDSLKVIGEYISPDCLVLIETTVPPGTTEYVAYPIIKKAFERRGLVQTSPVKHPKGGHGFTGQADVRDQKSDERSTKDEGRGTVAEQSISSANRFPPTASRSTKHEERRTEAAEPLLAHSFERVMPGRNYVSSIRDFWRVCSGINDQARQRVEKFLSEVLNVQDYPLTVLDRPLESETCKIVENSYRATILAFLNEWSLFSETNGVDLMKVIDAIKVRPTHDNIIFPGPGIGGYCLPKDGGLGVWAYHTLMGFEQDIFKITPQAIDINDTRALRPAQLTRDALRNMGKIVAASKIAVLGASYREDVGDTRYSGSEIVVRKLTEMGGDVVVHDPYVKHWFEFEQQETYPGAGHSRKEFFRNQDGLTDMRMAENLDQALRGADAVVLAVRHQEYQNLDPDTVVTQIGHPAAIIDCFGLLSDEQIKRYFELGCEVKGLGRGHVKRMKDQVKEKAPHTNLCMILGSGSPAMQWYRLRM
ncbi:nucleotide sugar dehydrogenase [Desulfovermiculus halophilus]|uniref:nucleotide sugar dehydrogenase n=1 Tax=Desulfovermiculus halophilus TaxID=339722 RepID=UPI001ABEF65C|nr:UDP binding domain-containing protein [Desulfovermiculus halophilus]